MLNKMKIDRESSKKFFVVIVIVVWLIKGLLQGKNNLAIYE
jgi:hypothetical protein